MSDRYVHLYPFTVRWDHRQDNLVTLGRYLSTRVPGAARASATAAVMPAAAPPMIATLPAFAT